MKVALSNRKIKRWQVWTLFLFFIVLVVVIGVFTAYSISLGGISSEAADWGSFGSLLSGIFTLVAAVAASAAFVVTRVQLDRLVDHQKEQEKSLVFDRYLKHRDLFTSRCRELEVVCGGRIRFYSSSELYKKLFPFNSPSYCIYEVSKEGDEELKAWIGILKKINEDLRPNPSRSYRFTDPVFAFARLLGALSIECQSNNLSRVVLSDQDQDLGYGLYDLHDLYRDLQVSLEELAFFAGSENRCFDSSGISWNHAIRRLRKEFDSVKGDAGLKLRDETGAIRSLHIIFEQADKRHRLEGYKDSRLGHLISNLLQAFESSKKLKLYLLSEEAKRDSMVILELEIEQGEEYARYLSEYQAR